MHYNDFWFYAKSRTDLISEIIIMISDFMLSFGLTLKVDIWLKVILRLIHVSLLCCNVQSSNKPQHTNNH